MKIAALAIGACLICSPASANFAQWCVDAYDAGKIELGERMARTVRKSMTAADRQEANLVIRCLRLATGAEYKYLPVSKRIIPAEEYDAEAADERAAAEAEEVERQRIAEETRREDELLREMAEEASRKRRVMEAAVLDQLAQSCARIFQRDPDAAITNKLCYDYFSAVGLPE